MSASATYFLLSLHFLLWKTPASGFPEAGAKLSGSTFDRTSGDAADNVFLHAQIEDQNRDHGHDEEGKRLVQHGRILVEVNDLCQRQGEGVLLAKQNDRRAVVVPDKQGVQNQLILILN